MEKIEKLQMQLKMQIEESECKIQDLEAENQALKRQLFQEGEQLQHEIEENMPRKEYSLEKVVFVAVFHSTNECPSSNSTYVCKSQVKMYQSRELCQL